MTEIHPLASPARRRALMRKRLLGCSNLIESHLNQKMRKAFGFTLARFDLLAEIALHPDGLRMSEVSSRLMVTAGNVTGLTDKLVAGELVTREPDPHDGRSFTLRLTGTGRARHAELAASYDDWLQILIGALPVTTEDALLRSLEELDEHLRPQHLASRNRRRRERGGR